MKIQRIKAENYKTYRSLDLSLEVTDQQPIILIGGANGCGKTTLFDAIYHALYGLEIRSAKEFDELFNAGVKVAEGIDSKAIILEITFTGHVLQNEIQYLLRRTYTLFEGQVREQVLLNMGGNTYTYGTATPVRQRQENEEVVNKIIAANLPRELSKYFLFDAMKTSELVKEEQISALIMQNINSVMGFNKYEQLRSAAAQLLGERKAERLRNEQERMEYQNLLEDKRKKEREMGLLTQKYKETLEYANDNKDAYEQLLEGRNADDVTRDKMKQLEQSIQQYGRDEKRYRADADNLAKEIEAQVIYPRLAERIHHEVEIILADKQRIQNESGQVLNTAQVERVVRAVAEIMAQKYDYTMPIDASSMASLVVEKAQQLQKVQDQYAYLNTIDVQVLEKLIHDAYVNPFIALDERRERLNNELRELPRRREQLQEYHKLINQHDFSLIENYQNNERRSNELKKQIADLKDEIAKMDKRLKTFDYDVPQEPDPQFEMLEKLPQFFKSLSIQLLRQKKSNIERKMKDLLNENLVVYAGVIGRVELSTIDSDDITFKIFHLDGNEIHLSQLNAGAKQTVMQVLLKVLYDLGDYDPPVMIDTVMGVLDKQSRETIMEHYFPQLARQTILLSTDTEITAEHDLEKLYAFIAHAYTLHRDKHLQCTTISEDYFGETIKD